MNKLKERIRELREEVEWTQGSLAKKINATDDKIYDWESGRSEPSVDYIIALAKIFEVSSDYLLGITDKI